MKLFKDIYVSTDDIKIKKFQKKWAVVPFIRSKNYLMIKYQVEVIIDMINFLEKRKLNLITY